jgi:hypothetical protein
MSLAQQDLHASDIFLNQVVFVSTRLQLCALMDHVECFYQDNPDNPQDTNMNKLIAAIAATTFAMGSAFAQAPAAPAAPAPAAAAPAAASVATPVHKAAKKSTHKKAHKAPEMKKSAPAA